MGMRPDAMERWGVVAILKESAHLLHKHFRLFMPFILSFALSASPLTAVQNVFLFPPTHTYMRFVKAGAAYTSTDQEQEEMGPTDRQSSVLILSYMCALLVLVFSNLASAAYTYMVAYIYSENAVDTGSDDDSITRKVFNLLPHAFLRIFVTQLWINVVLIFLTIICFSFAFILSTIVSAIIGGQLGPYPVFFAVLVVYAIGVIAITIKFALAIPIAVLEPEKYGRAALKQSSTYAKGRTFTIFCVIVLSIVIGVLFIGPLQAAKHAKVPPLVEITVSILVAILGSAAMAYVGIVGVVMYFVCKSSFEAVLPALQRDCIISAAEFPYELIGHGSTQP